VLSNDNYVVDDTSNMEVVEEVITTPIIKQATTPVALPKPQALSASDDFSLQVL
jgi:hypothetical protein